MPGSGLWARTLPQEGTPMLSPFPRLLLHELNSAAWKGTKDMTAASGLSLLCQRTKVQIGLFLPLQVFSPLLD